MIITCPHCQTKYQVTFEAIGSAGRKVQCAQCRRAWDQQPAMPAADGDDDTLFDAISEDALDDLMASEALAVANEAKAKAPQPPPPLPAPSGPQETAELRKRQLAFAKRQHVMIARQPLARLRRAARVIGVLTLVGMAAGLYLARTQIVERYPDLAGLYEAVGLGVNVVGLDFEKVASLKTMSGGKDVLMVSAQIIGLSPEPRAVPPVVVSLLDANDRPVYEWSVSPRARDLMAGERATFDTRLSLPPSEAVKVRLSFAGGGTTSPGTVSADQPAPEVAAAGRTEHD